MPQVRNRFCQIGSMSCRTVALPPALSKLSELSSTDSTATIHSTSPMPAVPPWAKPYHAASAIQSSANTIGMRKWRSMSGTQGGHACDTCYSVLMGKNLTARAPRGGHHGGGRAQREENVH